MKLVEEQHHTVSQKNCNFQQKTQDQSKSFIKPFHKFKNSISLAIKIHFFRFIFVTAIYYYSDVFFSNQKNISQPQSFLLFFLAMMIQIIKFIGDCSLRNLLKNQQKKLSQIHQLKLKTQNDNQVAQNITLKGAKYQDYMFIFTIIRIFKYQHKNYSSAYSISKYMHLICTFLVFGWMSLAEQYKEETNWIRLVVLQLFLLSIYFTSFEVDLYLIQTSQGKFSNQQKYATSNLSESETKMIMNNFKQWRNSYFIIQTVGTLFVLVAMIIDFKLSLLFFSALTVAFINICGYKMEKIIERFCQSILIQTKRDQINTYSVLRKSTFRINNFFKAFIMIQRFSILFLWMSFVRDQSLSLINFSFFSIGILLLIYSQIKKFSDGNKLKLMSIIQDAYSSDMSSKKQNSKDFQCAICLKIFQKGQSVNLLPCSRDHIFHSQCFEDWKKIKTQCPLCRYPLSEYI